MYYTPIMNKRDITIPFENAVICHANYARFGHNDRRIMSNPHTPFLQTRSVLLCWNASAYLTWSWIISLRLRWWIAARK